MNNVNQQVWQAAVAQVNKQILGMLVVIIGASVFFFISFMIFLFAHWVAGLIMMIMAIFVFICPIFIRKNMGLQSGCMKLACFNEQERMTLNQFEYERQMRGMGFK